MASNEITVNVTVKMAWYVAPAFKLAVFFVWLGSLGIKAAVK